MEKITRLSWANIHKHRIESLALAFLVMLCMMMGGSALSGTFGIKALFPQLMEQTGSMENYILIEDKAYDSEYENILRQKSDVEDYVTGELLYSMSTNYLDSFGKEQSVFMAFITEENERKFQHSEMESPLTEAEIAALEHPIWMPYQAKVSFQVKAGETFTLVCGTRKYPFTVAGFYDTIIMDSAGSGLKMIVSENDYRMLHSVLTPYRILAYNDHQGQGGDQMIYDLLDAFEAYANLDVKSGSIVWSYDTIHTYISVPVDMILKILLAMSGVIILSVLLMIRFRIASDIREQLVSIGVLGSLGYTSREIALSYVLEYLLIAAAGIVPGFGLCFVLTPLLYQIGSFMIGHSVDVPVRCLPILLTAAAILLLTVLIAWIRARMVRSYPPVRAFRKGQGDHRFGKEHLPLRDTKHNVHLRLAMKDFLANFRHSLGMTVCITVAAAAISTSFILYCFFGSNLRAIERTAGMELSDLHVGVMPTVDAHTFAEELAELPEVRKATPTTGYSIYLRFPKNNAMMLPVVFQDFSVTENIFPLKGRFPEHDNEVMMTNAACKIEHIKCGDTITLEYLNVKRNYIVSGIVTSTTNGGANLYITEDGMKRLYPNFRPDTIEVYLEEGTDTDAFRQTLTERYGRSITDAARETADGGDTASRIRAEAERQIAEMLASGDTTHVEYAIRYGDQLITGNSDNFRISSIMSFHDILEMQLGSYAIAISAITIIFMILSAVIVLVILLILMESTVRRQRRELGIMKGLGYTSKELMFQLASRTMPAAFSAVLLGTAGGIGIIHMIMDIFGNIGISIPALLVLDVLLLAFCFGCAYVGARKTRRISVCELMTE